MISIKNKDQIRLMSHSGSIAAFTLKQLKKQAKPGMTTFELDQIARRIIKARESSPSFLGYNDYPAAVCISVNDELVHGIPGQKKLKACDLVKIDIGIEYMGFHSDTAISFVLGKPSKDQKRLIEGVSQALTEAIKMVKPGSTVGDIEHRTGEVLRSYRLSPVLDLSGHGIGEKIHEDPSIRSDGQSNTGPVLKEGMVIAIEPMATLGSSDVFTSDDGWTIMTSDKSLAAHFEHTVAVTEDGHKILTLNK